MNDAQSITGQITVSRLNDRDTACEQFVLSRPEAKSCHTWAWSQAVCHALRLTPVYLAARSNGQVCGILPMVEVRSRLFGHRMVSQALSDYGGPLAADRAALDALFQEAVNLAMESGCESIEFRNVEALPYELHARSDKMCMHLDLPGDPEELWKGFDPKVRNQVRKAEKSGLTVSSGREELLEEFYGIYTVRMRQLGSPCYSRRVMQELMQAFPEGSRIFVVRKDTEAVGAGFTVCFNGFVEIPFAATLLEYNSLCPNNLLYWAVLQHYCRAGASRFDFGRCTVDRGPYHFKKQWGPIPVPLHYQYWAHPLHPLRIASPDDDRYRTKVELWKRLPLWVTRRLGPAISRKLP
jgi:serine/alanine adding enzyme